MAPHAFCKINEKDASKDNILNGDKVAIESSEGKIEAIAKVSLEYKEGVLSLPLHFETTLINELFEVSLDPISKEPNFKATWVKIYKN